MSTITPDTTVGELVRALPARARLFENLGIDYCCGGKRPLAEACRARNLEPATVVAMLAALDGAAVSPSANPDAMSLAELCDHIERRYHDWLREELPRLEFMTRKVAAVHGDHEPRLHDIRRVFEGFNAEMTTHLREEEEQIFPMIRQLESAKEGGVGASALQATLAKLEAEHGRAGDALTRFAELSDGYSPPEWACNTFRAMFDTLARLERNMHEHVHTENNVLFVKALAAAA